MSENESKSNSEAFYISTSDVAKIRGVQRRARLGAGGVVDFGVHGPIKAHYGLDAEPDLPLPVDYLVAATGA